MLQTARAFGEQLEQLAQRVATPALRLEAHEGLGTVLFLLGEYAAALPHFEQGLTLAAPPASRVQVLRHGVAPGVRCYVLGAHALWCLGYPVQSVQWSQRALTLAQKLAHPHSLAFAQQLAAHVYLNRREVPLVQEMAEALVTLAMAQGFPLYVHMGTFLRGWALAMQEQSTAGMAQMRQGMAGCLSIGHMLWQPIFLTLLAEAAGQCGQMEEGLRLLAEALAMCEASGRGDMLTEVYRLQGVLLLRQDPPDMIQAAASLQQALTVARRQQARSWELRAAMSLARLWQQQNKRAEAQQLLAGVYGWFTEGFDTADLQDARALLGELA